MITMKSYSLRLAGLVIRLLVALMLVMLMLPPTEVQAAAADKYYGSSGDGFALMPWSLMTLNGTTPAAEKNYGGSGDGFTVITSTETFLDGTTPAAERSYGGSGDGFALMPWNLMTLNGTTPAAEKNYGGSGDGFTIITSSAMFLSGPIWESYKEAGIITVWGTVGDPYTATTRTAYMYGEDFTAGYTYSVGFYDADGDKAGSDVSGTLTDTSLRAQFALNTDPTRAEGTWHAVVFDTAGGTPPATYGTTSGAAGYVTEDDFEVLASAIPEFPTVLAAIGVAGLCFGVYYWMRRRRLTYVQA